MLGPRHLPTSIQMHNFEQDHQKHQRKLEEIVKDDRKRKAVDKDAPEKSKLFETRAKGLKFHINERANQIEKDNELLLGKLVEISRKKKPLLSSVKSEGSLPKTLHGPSRKREKDRIAAENEAFARRLLSQQPSFDRRKLEVDYEKHNERVKQMQKLVGFSPRKVKLPPLHKDDFDVRKSTTLSEKKDDKHNDKKKNKKDDKIAEDDKEYLAEEEERREKEEAAKKAQKEKEEKEAQEKKEREEKEEKEREEKEKQQKEKKEQEEKIAKEQKEQEEKAAQGEPSQKSIVVDQHSKQDVGQNPASKPQSIGQSPQKDGTDSKILEAEKDAAEDKQWDNLEDKTEAKSQNNAMFLGMARANATKD